MKSSNICKFTFPQEISNISVSCFVLESNPDSMAKNKTLTHHCVILITEGIGTFSFSKKEYIIKKGTLVFAFKGEELSVSSTGNCQYMYILFDGNRADELFRRFGITPKSRVFDGVDGIIPLWRDSLTAANEKTIDLASESILLYTFSRLFKNLNKRDSLINKIIKISEEQFTDPDLSITSISDILGYNSKYLSHLFKEKMNLTYSEYLRNLRIQYAVSLFDHGIDSVKSVALLSGFSDPLYFSTVFKKSIGISPSEYKSRLELKMNNFQVDNPQNNDI